ncbi:MAG: ribonuclease, partial [Alphaproteobacteria bacterium]
MTIALVERGIGATRALVLDGDTVIGAHVERDDGGPRAGAVHVGRLATILVPGRRGIVRLGDVEALLEPLPAVAEGGLLRVEVVRAAVPEVARPRLAKLRAINGPAAAAGEVQPGPDLPARLAAAGHAITLVGGPCADRLEAAGWSETVEAARTGHVAFPGGLLTISPTPGMTVIDVDGPGDAETLAEAAAHA